MKNRFKSTNRRANRFAAHCFELLRDLKAKITLELASRFDGILDERRLRQVINEADALAATTLFPALVLPALAEETVHAAAAWQVRQRQLFERTMDMAA